MAISGPVTSIAGLYSIYGDGNLTQAQNNQNPPSLVVLGPAEKGVDRPIIFTEDQIDRAVKTYGTGGELSGQIQEARDKGIDGVYGVRICARAPFLMHIGGTGINAAERQAGGQENGYWVEPIYGGQEWGTRFGIAFQTASNRLILADLSLGNRIFDNSETSYIDEGLFYIKGTPGSTGSDIGAITASTFSAVPLASATTPDGDLTWYAGDDCTNPSRIALYEGLLRGLRSLEGVDYDYVAGPHKGSLDCPYGTFATAVGSTAYPSAGASRDQLMPVYFERVDNKIEAYWDPNADGVAEYWSVNDTTTYSGTSKGGKVFAASDFLEPNFAYLLGYHCYKTTYEEHFAQAIVPVELPVYVADRDGWLGTAPAVTTSLSGDVTVSSNGNGLFGEKYLAGDTGWRSGTQYGGMPVTDEPYFDSGTELVGPNDEPIDLGKFLTMWITPELMQPTGGVNNNRQRWRISPAAYAAFRRSLPPTQAPTEKSYPARRLLVNKFTRTQRANLELHRYTYAYEDNQGIRIGDAPTAAHPSSDYRRQGSIELVRFVDDALRRVSRPFIGRNVTSEEVESLKTELDNAISGLIAAKILRIGSFVKLHNPSATDEVTGRLRASVSLVVPFEIKRVEFTINLSQG